MLPSVASPSRTAKRKAEIVKEKRKRAARRLLAECAKEAAEFGRGVRTYADPTAAVQAILDGAFAAWQYAHMQMLQLAEDEYFEEQMGMTVPHAWIREEDRLAGKVLSIAAKAAAMGLAERQVRLEEQQAMIFSKIVEDALQARGIGAEERHAIHIQIAQGLDDIEGSAREIPTKPALTAA